MPIALEQFKSSEFNGVKELANAAARILQTYGASQEKGTVTEFPNERTIRYYLTEGLLPQPNEKRGLSSVFGYQHLLTLLVIKRLQSDGLPINVIKTIIIGRDVGELEKLIGEEIRVFTSRRDLDNFRSATGHTDDSEVMEIDFDQANVGESNDAQRSERNKAKEYLESLLLKKPKNLGVEDSPLFSMAALPPQARGTEPPTPSAESWRRYTITPGVEIHIEKNFKPPKNEQERSRIIAAVERVLHIRLRK